MFTLMRDEYLHTIQINDKTPVLCYIKYNLFAGQLHITVVVVIYIIHDNHVVYLGDSYKLRGQ